MISNAIKYKASTWFTDAILAGRLQCPCITWLLSQPTDSRHPLEASTPWPTFLLPYLPILRRVTIAKGRGHHQYQRLVFYIDEIVVGHAVHLGRTTTMK